VGKHLDDLRLTLDDSPIEHQVETLDATRARRESASPDDRDQAWFRFAETIDDLLATGDYDWAHDTLDGIRTTVLRSRRVTAAQERAVANVEDSRRGRRYEGYRGRGR